MNITKGIEVQSDTEWLIKFKKNIYGQCQSVRLYNNFLVGELTSSAVRFRQSNIYECMFYRG